VRATWGLAVAVICVLSAAAPASAATTFLAGAGSADVTPPLHDPAVAEPQFATCPAALYDGPRPFALSEPYADVSDDGRFNYPEPYCDANANGRYDGIYSSGGVDSLATRVHDPIDARAIAIGDGSKTIVYVSVVAQGLFENYTQLMREEAIALSRTAGHRPIDDVVVSANHNESSPDTVGIYGGPETEAGVGANSGIDDYYMDYLQHQVAAAAVQAADRAVPATLHAHQFALPSSLRVALSKNFPTTDDKGEPAAIDPKAGVLQARAAVGGKALFTVMSLAAHNQEVGHSAGGVKDISSDWPGYFAARLESLTGGGMAMFLVGDNGSEEDPITVPALPDNDQDPYPQAKATGEALADATVAALPKLRDLRFGAIAFKRETFTVPLENNAFKAAAAAGLFGDRPTYAAGQPAGRVGPDLRTAVSVLSAGPDLQLIGNPAEAFPALMVGSPWGIEDAPCASRPNPPVPTWHATASYRFQVGLADDMIGYISPPWAFTDVAGIYVAPPECQNDPDTDKDSKGHQHKLETEGVGPTAGGLVADRLTAVLKGQGTDPAAVVRPGRFIYADGSLGRRPAGAVGVWVAGSPATVVALPGVTGFSSRAVDSTGRMMDFDGAEQPGDGDLTTRGMLVYGCDGRVAKRFYLDLYPAQADLPKLGVATGGSTEAGCGAGSDGPRSGPVPPQPPPVSTPSGAACKDRRRPRTRLGRVRLSQRRVLVRGRSGDRGCAGVSAVLVSISKPRAGRCRFVGANGRLTAPRKCRRPLLLLAHGRGTWKLALKARLPRGRYRVLARAVDRLGNKEQPAGRALVRARVR
jgi:hypothetical protein